MKTETNRDIDLTLDWNSAFVAPQKQEEHSGSISDALVRCLTTRGNVDIEYIAELTGESFATVIDGLKEAVYQNPETWEEVSYKGFETAEEYLSGNLMRKWRSAKAAEKKYPGRFARNLKAIEKVLPPTVAAKDIYVTLGSPWVPADMIDDFIRETFGDAVPVYSVRPGLYRVVPASVLEQLNAINERTGLFPGPLGTGGCRRAGAGPGSPR